MAIHIELTRSEAADRLAIRELFHAYAHCADRLRYLDVSSKIDISWCFAERALSLEWSETRALNTPVD